MQDMAYTFQEARATMAYIVCEEVFGIDLMDFTTTEREEILRDYAVNIQELREHDYRQALRNGAFEKLVEFAEATFRAFDQMIEANRYAVDSTES